MWRTAAGPSVGDEEGAALGLACGMGSAGRNTFRKDPPLGPDGLTGLYDDGKRAFVVLAIRSYA